MGIHIGGADSARWSSHIAQIHLRRDCQRLATDVDCGAEDRIITADKAAIVESSHDVTAGRAGGGRLDVTA